MRVSTHLVVPSLSITVLALSCFAPAALAAWGRVTITPTAASIPLVEGCYDGAGGTFVAWQEGSPTGVVRAQHLLATGVLDPSWPAAGAAVCDVAAARTELAAVPDRQGGVYISWKENLTLYVTRLEPGGAVAAGWPARGRSLGGVSAASPRPVLIEDGDHGICVAWVGSPSAVIAMHLGPANTGAGGWPNSARTLSSGDAAFNSMHWPQLALAPDGGLFAAWAVSTTDEDQAPSAWRLRRFTTAGLNAAGWPTLGLSFGSFQRGYLGGSIRASLIAVSPDGRGGVFLSIGNPTGSDPNGAILESRLYRLQGSGESAADWPAVGVVVSQAPYYYIESEFGPTPDYSYRVFPDGADGALAGYPQFGLHSTSNVSFAACDDAGQFEPGYATYATAAGNEVAADGLGGHFVASFHPTGPTGPYQPYAFLGVRHTNEAFDDWTEFQFECCVTFYGDIGLASTEDGGAVFFWSQSRDRIGLFAQRFNSSGAVTAVEPAPPGSGISIGRLRFESGVGVRAAVRLASGDPARFELFDIAGRRIASQTVQSFPLPAVGPPEDGDLTLVGTADLRSGHYFGRLVQSGRSVTAKLIVAR